MKREEAHGPTELVEKTLHESEDEDTSEQGLKYVVHLMLSFYKQGTSPSIVRNFNF